MTEASRSAIDYIASPGSQRRSDMASLADTRIPEDKRHGLADILDELRLSRPVIIKLGTLPEAEVRRLAAVAHCPAGMSCSVVSLELRSAFGVRGRAWISTADSGALSGVRVEIDSPPVVDAPALVDALRLLDPTPAVHLRHGDHLYDTGHVNDVASLSKIFILDAVLRSTLVGGLRLDDRHVVRSDQICPLSAGLSPAQVGCMLTVAELCTLMILRSDNTAADILLELVGPGAVEAAICRAGASRHSQIRSMRAHLEESWGMTADAEHLALELPPVHPLGLGHFIPLAALGPAMDAIVRGPWMPWPTAGDPLMPLFKGGSAPGVLSAMWFGPDPADRCLLAFSVNNGTPYGVMEDLYATQCAEALLWKVRSQPTPPEADAHHHEGAPAR